ncbi:hypothetical protein LMG28614_01855 [Paraburkholderia ultramafica]|uniref:Uncharacterized protein n=1 Tax=Paraburkholderia ultramafica TaxID=1544867 RepID=A0A6S7B0S4_9BURK|nr:hypothetical protein LMG28614_01855 [Paraburkholderia ultramafica]
MPVALRLNGPVPVQMDAKGKIGIDVRVATDQGLTVSQSGVDTSGAPRIVGNVGLSHVTAR